MIGIVDAVLFLFLLAGAVIGFKRGVIKSLVNFIGTLACIVLAFYLKNPLSVLMYTNLPFFKLGGIFEGVAVVNILIYEVIAYLIVLSILFAILKIVLMLSGIVEKILKATVILAIPSKILGLIFGTIEAFIIAFVVIFTLNQIPGTRYIVDESKIGTNILEKTPILSSIMNDAFVSFNEIYYLGEQYKSSQDKSEYNRKAFEILIKNEVISTDNARKLLDSKKLTINNADEIINKYEKEKK